ncbi:DUF1073 domain-containing protein [Paraburkholderia sediminicola]
MPSGLNATSEGELRTLYSWIEAQQEALFTPPLSRLLTVIQLLLFGETDPDIGFRYVPLWTRDELQQANLRKIEAETDSMLINENSSITPEESRTRLAAQEAGPYASLDLKVSRLNGRCVKSMSAAKAPVCNGSTPNDCGCRCYRTQHKARHRIAHRQAGDAAPRAAE